jgi:hypothetical protein
MTTPASVWSLYSGISPLIFGWCLLILLQILFIAEVGNVLRSCCDRVSNLYQPFSPSLQRWDSCGELARYVCWSALNFAFTARRLRRQNDHICTVADKQLAPQLRAVISGTSALSPFTLMYAMLAFARADGLTGQRCACKRRLSCGATSSC